MIKYVGTVRPSAADGLVAEVYRQMRRVNRCPWCVDAHTTMLRAGAHGSVVDELGRGELTRRPDSGFGRIAAWAAATRTPGNPALRSAPFGPRDAPEMIGTAVVFHYLKRVVTILLPERLLPSGGVARKIAGRGASLWFSRALRRPKTPGESLRLLPDAPLPPDLSWAASAPNVAAAFARWVAVVERAGADVLDPAVRAVVQARVDAWRGEDPGLSRAWVEQAVRGLDKDNRPAGQLALLTALAPYQVDDTVIHAFRERSPGDPQLLTVLAWSSLAAARRVGSWIDVPVA